MNAPPAAFAVTCTRCNAATTVPFAPTPGRPVYCRDCFRLQNNGPNAPPQSGTPRPAYNAPRRRDDDAPARPQQNNNRRRMLAMGRKGHFVHDMREVLNRENRMDENQRRVFIEMVFSRGSRQSTEAAVTYLREKLEDNTLTKNEAEDMRRLVERYSFWR